MLTQARLKELFDYSPETGVFTRKSAVSQCKAGDSAGSLDPIGYLRISVDGNPFWAHRLAWLYVTGSFPLGLIDHINRVKTDNRILNLRDVTQRENVANSGLSRKNTSGHKGVSWHKALGRWMVKAKKDGKNHYIGSSKDLAAAVAIKARWDSLDDRMPNGYQGH